jgi:hypothetical protein
MVRHVIRGENAVHGLRRRFPLMFRLPACGVERQDPTYHRLLEAVRLRV